MAELTEAQKKAIDNYGNDVRTLKDFVEACQTRPGQFIGPIGNAGFLNMMREIFQNAVDQIIDQTSPATWFRFCYDERSLEVTVEDGGKSFPYQDMMRMITKEYTSKNYTKVKGDYSSGLNGVGLKVVNALSTNVVVTAFHYDGTAMKIETVKGYPKYSEPKPVPNKGKKQGSSVSFIPNTDILGDLNLSWRIPYDLIKHILSLTPIGSTCYFEAIDINGVAYKETIVNKDGIITDLIMKVQKPIIKPIITAFDDGEHKLETAFTWDFGDTNSGPLDNESVTSFSNFCPTREGTHIDGTIDGICTWLVKYMNDIYLSNQKAKDKLKVVANDIKTGLNVMISAAVLEPEFTGQAKERLSNDDMKPFCKEVVMRGMTEWSKNSPQDLQKIAKFIKDIAENRAKQEAGKAKIVQKYQSNSLTNLPSKYIRPLGKDHIELFIVEGDSAMGTVTNARDPKTQGVFPIRGKIINAFNCTREKFYENEEVQAIHRIIFGRDYKRGDKVTLEDVKVEKVVFMADADVDRIVLNCRKMLFV